MEEQIAKTERKRRDKNSFETRLCEVTLLLLFASVVSILGVRGLVEQYLARWISLLSPLSWLAVLLVSLKMISPKKRKILPVLLLGFLGIFTVMNINQVDLQLQSRLILYGLKYRFESPIVGPINEDSANLTNSRQNVSQ